MWDARKLRMHGVTRPGTGNTIANIEIGNAFPDSNDRSRTAVAQSARLIETASNRSHSREQTIPPNLADHFANQIWSGFGLLQQVLAGELTGGALGPG